MDNELETLVSVVEAKSVVRQKSRQTNAYTYWLRLCVGILAWGVLLLVLVSHQQQQTGSSKKTTHLDENGGYVLSNPTKWYRQDRPIQRLGRPEDGYVEINTYDSKVAKRIEDMQVLNQIRFGRCGRFGEFLSGANDTNWRYNNVDSEPSAKHCDTGEDFRNRDCTKISLVRYLCEDEHPTMKDVTVTIERFGQFSGRGGNDWTSLDTSTNLGGLEARLRGKNMAYVGGMAAPVFANGTIIGYPPLHIHHAHVHPHASRDERGAKIHGSTGDYHHLLLQSHGDSECHQEEGGVACLLEVLDLGSARVVDHSESGLSANFDINDVRPAGSDELLYWFEIVLMFTEYDNNSTRKRTTHIGTNNPCVGKGPCTYAMPFDPHSNMNVYNYTHGRSALAEEDDSKLSSGTMSNFILHTHQTIMDSFFVFHSSDGAVYQALYDFRRDRELPLILECREDEGEEQIYDLEAAKQELFRRVSEAGGKLVCEATRPSLRIDVDPTNSSLHHIYDKRSRLNCLRDPVPLRIGDVLTVLAFNEIRPHQDMSRCKNSLPFRRQSAFQDAWALQQHTIFRFDLSYEKEPVYAPPAFFHYSKHYQHNPVGRNFQNFHTGCPFDLIRYDY